MKVFKPKTRTHDEIIIILCIHRLYIIPIVINKRLGSTSDYDRACPSRYMTDYSARVRVCFVRMSECMCVRATKTML
jgi:hypothetical protein